MRMGELIMRQSAQTGLGSQQDNRLGREGVRWENQLVLKDWLAGMADMIRGSQCPMRKREAKV